MTTAVRVFYYSGVVTAPVAASSGRYSTDSVQLLQQPYLGRDLLSCDTVGVGSTDGSHAPAGTAIARIEVQPGRAVYYEVSPSQSLREADQGSPLIEGQVTISFGPGWKLSFLEAMIK